MKLPKVIFVAWVAVAISVSYVLWLSLTPNSPPINKWVEAKVAPQVKAIPKIAIKPPQVKVYAPQAKARLSLPQEVQTNPTASVLAATIVRSDIYDTTVVTIIDELTGETQTIARKEPLPLFRLKNSGEIRLDFGVKKNWGYNEGAKPIARLTVRQDVFQVKRMTFGVVASADSDGDAFAGVGVGLRW